MHTRGMEIFDVEIKNRGDFIKLLDRMRKLTHYTECLQIIQSSKQKNAFFQIFSEIWIEQIQLFDLNVCTDELIQMNLILNQHLVLREYLKLRRKDLHML